MRTVVGRERELEAITSFLAGGAGRSHVLMIEGAAGIGKTAVWEAALRTASESGFLVLAARPLEAETRIPFAGAADLLAGALDAVAGELPPAQRVALEVALSLRDPDGPPPGPQAIAFAFLSALRALAHSTPALVAVDDLKWVDPSTAAVLAYAMRRLGEEPIRLLCARRSAAAASFGEPVDGTRIEVITLGPLSEGALQRIFHEQLGDGLPRRLLHRVHRTSGGNPLHALELAQALAQQGYRLDPGDPLPVLRPLADLVEARLAALPAATVRALRIAALSPEPTLALLATAMDEPFDLAPAVWMKVVAIEGDRVVFSHSLFPSAIAARSSASARQGIHGRLGELSSDPEARAQHLALSATLPDAGIAAELESAAGTARGRGSPAAAAELLEHALRLSPRDEGVTRRTIAAADAHFEAGDTQRALALLEALSGTLPPSPERAEVLYRHAAVRAGLDCDMAACVELYERALAEPGLEPQLEARIRSDLAWLAIFVSNVTAGIGQAQLAVAAAERSGSPIAHAEALTALAFVELVAGEPWPDGRLDPALALEASGERFRIDRCPSLLAGVRLLWGGRLEAARTRLESVRCRALDRGDETNASIADYHLVELELHFGAIDSAAARAQKAVQLATQTGVNTIETCLAEAAVDAHRGRIEAAVEAATHVLAIAELAHDRMNALRALAVLGRVGLARGRPLEAHVHLSRALEFATELELGEPALLRFIPDAVEALVSLDRLPEAQAALARFETPASRLGHVWALASVDRCRGLVRAASGDLPGGLADLQRARAAYAQLPFPLEHGRTLLTLGTVERRARHLRDARTSLDTAFALFERIAAPLWAARAQAELERIGGRTPSGDALTLHERRIAELVAAGRTNREVAAELVVSVHTIEAALTRIYGKLHVRSRTQLAAHLAAVVEQSVGVSR